MHHRKWVVDMGRNQHRRRKSEGKLELLGTGTLTEDPIVVELLSCTE